MEKDKEFINIKGFETYSINKYGEIKRDNKLLKLQKSKSGYLQVLLWKNGKPYSKRIHRLVAETFLDKVEGKDIVNHKDGNILNNNADNLEWVTVKENTQHAFNKLYRKIGFRVIDNKGNIYDSYRDAERKTGISANTVKNDCIGKTKGVLKNGGKPNRPRFSFLTLEAHKIELVKR